MKTVSWKSKRLFFVNILLSVLMHQSFRTGTPVGIMRILDILKVIMYKTKIYRLGGNMYPEAAHIAYDGMQVQKCDIL